MNADGSGQRRLTRAPRDDFVSAWSPTGRIAFPSRRDGNQEIYIMNTDGSEQRNLTRSPADDRFVRLVARADEIRCARGSSDLRPRAAERDWLELEYSKPGCGQSECFRVAASESL